MAAGVRNGACTLTAGVTALANLIACRLSEAELNLLALVLTQLGDTLGTIAAQRACCATDNKSPSVTREIRSIRRIHARGKE